ncbi:MAG: single-stranded DNA-binding protein, partial [Chloroflexi bacterium]|nr:single-stranded DNA-binding protein [Chloroflexota bacterium]
VKETTWFRISTWGKTAEVCNQYLKKGSKVLVEGRLKPDPDTGSPRTFTRQDGTTGASFELTANQVRFLSTRVEDEGAYSADDSQGISEPEDIPF